MVKWINHVAIAADRNGTTTHTGDPSTGTVVTGSLFTPTAGNLLVCVFGGSVTATTPSGWTLPTGGSAINNAAIYIWYRTAAGGDTFTTTHNASNYPVVFDFYEFPAGSTFIGSAAEGNVSATGGAGPSLSGLTSTANLRVAAGCQEVAVTTAPTYTWSVGTEAVDTAVINATTAGYGYSMAYVEDATTATFSSAETSTLTSRTIERIVFAINAAAAGGSSSANPADSLGIADSITAPADRPRTQDDSLGLTDSAQTAVAADRTAADSVGLTDSVQVSSGASVDPADSLGISDSVGLARSISLADAVGATDSAATVASSSVTAADSVGVTDNVTVALSIARTIADQIGATDNASADLTAPGSANIDDPLGVTDLLTTTAQILRSAGDSLGITDAVTTALERTSSPGDPVGISDSVTVQAGAAPSLADGLGISDSAVAVLERVVAIGDQVGALDSVIVSNPAIPPLPTTGVSLTASVDTRGLSVTAESRSLEVTT